MSDMYIRYKFTFNNNAGYVVFYQVQSKPNGVDDKVLKKIKIASDIVTFNNRVNTLNTHPLIQVVGSLSYINGRQRTKLTNKLLTNFFKK